MTEINPYAPPRSEFEEVAESKPPEQRWDGKTSLALKSFRQGWDGFWVCFPRIFGVLLVTYVPLDFASAWYDYHYANEADPWKSFRFDHLLNQWLYVIPDGAFYWIAWNHFQGRFCGIVEALGVGLTRYWQMWWTRFLLYLSYLSFLLLIFPGIYLTTRLALAEVSVVTEQEAGTRALGRSWDQTRGVFWRVLGAVLLASVPSLLLYGLVTAFWEVSARFLPEYFWWMDGLLECLMSLSVPFFCFVVVALHWNLQKVSHEAETAAVAA